jgi:uncharacterized membrane protein YsdA (DUF1294 family)
VIEVPSVLAVYLVTSLLALGAFAFDKRRARLGRRRVPEATLHAIELAGGWPGALVAMQLVRHKRRKPSYWLVTLAIAGLHVAGWALALGWIPA